MSLLLALALSASSAPVCSLDDGPQQAMNQCAQRRFEVADAALNAQWPRTMAVMRARDAGVDRRYDSRPGYVVTLRAAQRAWITYRDQHCAIASYEARGGSMEAMLYGLCREEMTQERTRQLIAITEAFN